MKILIILLNIIYFTFQKQPSFWAQYGIQFKKLQQQRQVNQIDEYQIGYFDQIVDHSTFTNQAQQTFKQKYLVRSKYWIPQSGPIFFYCGNEGPVEMFYQNSGFLNDDLAKRFGALIIYVEHRYFGESYPFGTQEISYQKQNLKYLTSEQALQDFLQFLKWYKKNNCPNCQIIAFGGSYGGMLASWLRMKYPNIVDGSLAASAPIYYFMNREGIDPNSFYKIATSDFTSSSIGSLCPKLIREAFRRIEQYKVKDNYDVLNSAFRTCTPITNLTGVEGLENYINNGFTYMSMTNYPYDTQFLKKLPGWPTIKSCELLKGVGVDDSDAILFNKIREAVEIYYNYEGLESCNEVWAADQSSDQDMSGWDILACADMVMPMYSDGINDMFPPQPWDSKEYSAYCYEKYGILPNYNYTLDHYGGVTDDDMLGYSNIFFSNGKLDPWSGGSPIQKISDKLPAIYMDDCSHHLDLRPPNDQDPMAVKLGRLVEIKFIENLIIQKNKTYQKL